jgi:hypothetical protein
VDHSPCASCAIETHKTTRILCLFWDRAYSIISTIFFTNGSIDHETVDIKSCSCHSLASILVEHGFFPTAPNQPRIAISIDFLELYHALFEHTGDAVTAMSAALSKFYLRRGYPVNNKKVRLSHCKLSVTYVSPGRAHKGSVPPWVRVSRTMVRLLKSHGAQIGRGRHRKGA